MSIDLKRLVRLGELPRSGRPAIVCSSENVRVVQAVYDESLTKSTRRFSREMRISTTKPLPSFDMFVHFEDGFRIHVHQSVDLALMTIIVALKLNLVQTWQALT